MFKEKQDAAETAARADFNEDDHLFMNVVEECLASGESIDRRLAGLALQLVDAPPNVLG